MQADRQRTSEETMKTEFIVEYNLYDTTALQDARETSGSNAPFADIGKIKEDLPAPAYGTLEHNFFVLDESREEFPHNPKDLVYFSAGQSDADGRFPEEQSVTVQFTKSHTSVGLTLSFLDAYPLELEIYWYDLDGKLKSRMKFFPDALVYFCRHQVEEYGRLRIVFLKALPWHNVKLQHIEYGTSILWNSDTLKSGKLVNAVDPISNRLSTDTLTFDFVDKHDDFNLGNQTGMHKTFQRRQSMTAYERTENGTVPLGTFFLDSSAVTKNICRMTAIDYKGMLANVDFIDGKVYEGDEAGGVIAQIMASAGITDYEVDEETAGTPLYGTLKIQSCQKALREVLFACGSIISTSRQTGVTICKNKKTVRAKISRNRKFETTLQTDPYVSDVSVKYQTWTLEDNVSEIAKGVYPPGTHMIQLTKPAADMTASAGRILKQMPYYVVLEIPARQRSEVTISGRKYVSHEMSALASVGRLKSGEICSSKAFTGTLLSPESAQRAASSILDYYQLQQIINTKYLAGTERAGDWAEIENPIKKHGNFISAIESLTTDLAGGFISTAKCRGYYKNLTDYYIAGEICSGEEFGII